ncbi:hypothetical protein Pfo_031651 [Paulownia fortunei]|nr:hypothetical protein Pfo_031651 [Paulownia fortunei]
MASVSKWGRRGIALGAGAAATALVLTGCASSSVLDTDLNGLSIARRTRSRPSIRPGPTTTAPSPCRTRSPTSKPDIAESGEFTNDTTYTVKLKSGLKFANVLVRARAEDQQRERSAVAARQPQEHRDPDDTTVVFNLDHATRPAAGALEPRRPDRRRAGLLGGRAHPGGGHRQGQGVRRAVRDHLVQGERHHPVLGEPRVRRAPRQGEDQGGHRQLLHQETDLSSPCRRATSTWRTAPLTPTDIAQSDADERSPRRAPGRGRRRRPREDREGRLQQHVLAGLLDGAGRPDRCREAFEELYGNGKGGPDVDKAKETLSKAGVTGKVQLDIQYAPDHYGSTSDDEYAELKTQLENFGLADEGLLPGVPARVVPGLLGRRQLPVAVLTKDNFVQNHYDDPEIQKLISEEQQESDKDKRAQLIEQAQEREATQISTLPLLQGKSVAVAGKDVKGLTLDSSRHRSWPPTPPSPGTATCPWAGRGSVGTSWSASPHLPDGVHPGDARLLPDARHREPDHASVGGRLTPSQLQERLHAAGYDRPVIVQYLEYSAASCAGTSARRVERQPSDHRGHRHVRRATGSWSSTRSSSPSGGRAVPSARDPDVRDAGVLRRSAPQARLLRLARLAAAR